MKKNIILVVIFIIGILIGLSLNGNDKNNKLEYGTSGAPKNCRAIIKKNIDEYKKGTYTAEEILDSIDRNCGEFGYSR